MSSLSKEQAQELTAALNQRLEEFEIVSIPTITVGIMRLAYDVIEEWLDADMEPMPKPLPNNMGEVDVTDGYHIGWQRGREELRRELGLLEQAGGWVGSETVLMTDFGGATLRVPGVIEQASVVTEIEQLRAEADQLRADAKELGEHWPDLDDEPPAGTMERLYADMDEAIEERKTHAPNEPDNITLVGDAALAARLSLPTDPPPLLEPLPEPIESKIPQLVVDKASPMIAVVQKQLAALAPAPATNGNGHHAELSPTAVATLGPEHTAVTPLVPRRSGKLSEVDEAALSRTRLSKDELAADLRATIHALQDMAVDGEMPSMNDWLLNRPAGMMTAQGIMKRHNLTWAELAEYAKLKLKGKRGGRQQQ